MRLARFDCFSGASGDMILGAMLDAGLSLELLREDIARLGLPHVEIHSEKVTRAGLAGTHVRVAGSDSDHGHRHLGDILELIRSAKLPERVRSDAECVFHRLAEAEARVHNIGKDEVHFHEVGAVDSIADIVGAAIGLARLEVDRVFFSRLAVGRGYVNCAHGRLPVPAPATARLIEGYEVEYDVAEGELLTPTGAAILTTLGEQARSPAMRVEAIGYGAGAHDREELPNLLRLTLGETVGTDEADRVWVVETNLDDCSPEVVGFAADRARETGALDVFLTPIQMKKSRPGVKLTAIVGADRLEEVEAILFQETSTFGIRRYEASRSKLSRCLESVDTPFGSMRVKVGRRGGRVLLCEPEYEDCRRVAVEKKMPLREVMQRVREIAVRNPSSCPGA